LKAASGAQYIIRLVEILPQDTLYDILALVDNKRLPVIKEISVDLNLFYFSSAASGSSFNEFENFTNYQIAESLLITGRDKDIEAWIENILLKVSLRYSIPLSKVYGTLIQISGELRSEPMISFLNAYKKAQNIDSASLNSGIKKKYDHEYDNKDLTKYYLIYQSLPKWTSLRSEKSLKALIAKLSDQVLLELFNELKGEERAINNLTKFLSDKTVWTLIVKIDPIHGGEMKKVKEDLVSFQKNMRFFDMSPDEFVKEVSTQFLLEMVLFQVRITSMELVVGNVIQHLSKRAGNTLSQTVQVLASQSRQFKSTYLKFWLSGQPLLQEVYTEEASGYKPPPTAIDADLDREANWLLSGVRKEYQDRYDSTDIILEYLETGVIPQWSLLNTPQGLAQLIEEGLKSSPSKLGALLLNWKITDQSVERWKVLFNDTQTWEVLHILDASNTRKVKIVVEDLLAVHHSSTVWSIPRSSFKQTLVLNAVQGIIELHKSAKSIEYTIKNLLLVVVKIATYKPESIYVNLSKFFHLLNSSILKSLIQTEITSLTSTATEAGQPTFQTFNSIQNDIDLFLYLVQYKVYPWWYDQPDKTGSPKVEVYIRQLTESLSQEHLDGLLKSIYESSKPTVFLDHIISHAPRETYYRILNVLAPRVAGFANNYLMVLEEWSIKTTSKLSTDTLIKVLYYVRKVSSSFSAREFIFNVTKYLSDQSGKEVMKIMEEAELVISSRIEKGESRFVPLKEIVNNLRQTSVAGPYEIEDTYEGQAYTMPTSGNGSDFERDLTYYLVHHTLPIRAGTDYKSKDEFFAAYDSYLSKSPNNLKSLLIRELSESHMFSRLVKSQHVDFLDRILIGLSSSHYDTLKRWQSSMNLFINMIIPKIGKSTGEMISWKVLLKHLVEHGLIQMDLKTYVNKSLLALELSYYSEIFKDLSGILARIDIEKQIGKDFLSALISIVNAKPEVPKPTEVRKEESINNLESEPAIEGQISINNAGMVIFASFLPRYFEVLNMVENGRFKNEDLSSRAVLLVQYLTTGIAKAPEHELILNKVLCGVAINVPVEAEIQLTDQEEELSESLLSGVRQNWGKLEGSSNDGLRQGFLMRGGQLWETDGSFKLKVEKKTMDILLDYMPWSFKLTKLSWMKKPLEVEWL
ncbi:MAG: contractile injection system tape measure protein, partial [Bacteroidota bacterium]